MSRSLIFSSQRASPVLTSFSQPIRSCLDSSQTLRGLESAIILCNVLSEELQRTVVHGHSLHQVLEAHRGKIEELTRSIPFHSTVSIEGNPPGQFSKGYFVRVSLDANDVEATLSRDKLLLSVLSSEHHLEWTRISDGRKVQLPMPYILEGTRMYGPSENNPFYRIERFSPYSGRAEAVLAQLSSSGNSSLQKTLERFFPENLPDLTSYTSLSLSRPTSLEAITGKPSIKVLNNPMSFLQKMYSIFQRVKGSVTQTPIVEEPLPQTNHKNDLEKERDGICLNLFDVTMAIAQGTENLLPAEYTPYLPTVLKRAGAKLERTETGWTIATTLTLSDGSTISFDVKEATPERIRYLKKRFLSLYDE